MQVTLEVKGETQLLNLSEKLKAGGVAHKLWIEQPENFATCLATKPCPKSTVSSFFKKLKLCKWWDPDFHCFFLLMNSDEFLASYIELSLQFLLQDSH